MASGGFRPGAGRPKGAKDKKPRKATKATKATKKKPKNSKEKENIREMLSYSLGVKARIYQDYLARINRGESLTIAEKKMMDSLGVELAAEIKDDDVQSSAKAENLDPLTYMLKVMNDESADPVRRDRMAGMAAPFCHPRKGAGQGKKEDQADRAAKAAGGRFAARQAPKIVSMVKK